MQQSKCSNQGVPHGALHGHLLKPRMNESIGTQCIKQVTRAVVVPEECPMREILRGLPPYSSTLSMAQVKADDTSLACCDASAC